MSDPRITLGDLALYGVEPSTSAELIVPQNGLDWSSAAGSSLTVEEKRRSDGGWAGDGFREPRDYALTVVAIGPERAATERVLDMLHAAASLHETPLGVAEDSLTRWTTVRRFSKPEVTWLNDTAARWSVQLIAPDPRKFGDELSASTGLPSSTGGVTFPLAFPVTFDAVTNSGQVSLTNDGNIAGPVRLRIDGPVTGPVVTHVGTGRSLIFSTSLVLGEGEFIPVDAERREVLAQGQSSRNGWVTGRGWPLFVPGVNTYSFSAMTHSPGALLTVAGSPAWE